MLKQNSMKRIVTTFILIALVAFSLGCTDTEQSNIGGEMSDELATETPASEEATENRIATIETEKGIIKFELYEKRAPITTANFIKLAESGFYEGLIFHRIVPGFVIQGGDPQGTGMGGSDETINLEIHPELRHTDGAVAMARSNDRNSASSQFYITLGPQPALDDDYAVFGQVIEGKDVVGQIVKGDKMLTVTIGTE